MTETDRHLLFVGSYAAAEHPGIYAFALDRATGALTPCGAFAGVTNPSFLALHPGGQILYAASETSAGDGTPGCVAALRIDQAPLALDLIGTQRSGGDWPCHLAVDRSGRWLLASNYGSGTVGVLPILPDGALGPLSDLARHEGRSADAERQEGPHTHCAAFTPDGMLVVVADLGIDQLVVYQFDPAGGKLGTHGYTLAPRGAGPRHLAFHPGGRTLYVANELANTVSVFSYDAALGQLHEHQIVSTLPPDTPDSQVADIHLDEAGRRLYVSNRGHNSLAVFDVVAGGRLTLAGIAPCGGDWPRSFALVPGGAFVVVANQKSGEVAVLPLAEGPEPVGSPVARAPVAQAACVLLVGPG